MRGNGNGKSIDKLEDRDIQKAPMDTQSMHTHDAAVPQTEQNALTRQIF
jgi:hypothetical protein